MWADPLLSIPTQIFAWRGTLHTSIYCHRQKLRQLEMVSAHLPYLSPDCYLSRRRTKQYPKLVSNVYGNSRSCRDLILAIFPSKQPHHKTCSWGDSACYSDSKKKYLKICAKNLWGKVLFQRSKSTGWTSDLFFSASWQLGYSVAIQKWFKAHFLGWIRQKVHQIQDGFQQWPAKCLWEDHMQAIAFIYCLSSETGAGKLFLSMEASTSFQHW